MFVRQITACKKVKYLFNVILITGIADKDIMTCNFIMRTA